jgi:hypothetical protein
MAVHQKIDEVAYSIPFAVQQPRRAGPMGHQWTSIPHLVRSEIATGEIVSVKTSCETATFLSEETENANVLAVLISINLFLSILLRPLLMINPDRSHLRMASLIPRSRFLLARQRLAVLLTPAPSQHALVPSNH